MNAKTKILIAEHDPIDLELLVYELKKSGINYVSQIVDNELDFSNALKSFIPDIILSDYAFPSFNGSSAFKIKQDIAPEIPFIFVTGTLDEEVSVAFIKNGVTDYVLKDKLFTLSPKIKRGLKEAEEKQEKNIVNQELIRSEKKFRNTLDNMLEGIQIHDFNFRYIYVNDAVLKHGAFSREELLGFTLMEKYPGIEQSDLFKVMQRCMTERVAEHFETEFVFPDGIKTQFELSIQPIPEGISILSVDRTEQKRANEKLKKANRLYSFISHINKSLISAKDEQILFDEACKIAVEQGKFKMAWIGIADITARKINLIASCGASDSDLRILSDKTYDINGLTEKVLQGKDYHAIIDIKKEPGITWDEYAAERGFISAISLPIKKAGNVVGTFDMYSSVTNYFDAEEIQMLEEVAADISFGLDFFQKEKLQKETEELIIQSEQVFRALTENSTDMKTLTSKEGKMLYGSPSIMKGLGYTTQEFLVKYPHDLIHPDDLQHYMEKRSELIKTPGNSFHFVQRRHHKNGDWIWCEGTITNMLEDTAIQAMVSNFRDISKQKKAEKLKEFDRNNLNALINNTADLMWSVDRDFNLITSNLAFDEMGKINFGKTIARGDNVLSTASTPEMLGYFKQLYERAFKGEAFIETSYFDTPVEFWTEIYYNPIRRGDKIIGTACHSRDITERKRTENRLAQSEARLKEAQALSHISNWEVDLVTGISTWSDEFYRILGISREDVEASPEAFLSCIDPDDYKYAKEKVEKTFETFKGSSFHVRIKTKDATSRYVYSEWEFEFDKNNKPIRMYGILQDITESKLAEINLKQSEARLSEAQAIGAISNWEIDMVQDTITWSDELYNIFGINKDEVQTSTELFFSFIHPDDIDQLRKNVQETLDSLKGSSSNFRFFRKDGALRYGHIERKIKLDKNNKPIRLYGILQDVTEQKKAELILIESEARLAEAQSLAKIGSWETDLLTLNAIWSAETFRIFELKPGNLQVSHSTFLEYVHPDDRLKIDDAFKGSLNKDLINSIEHRIITPTGIIKTVEERWQIFRDDKGISKWAVGTCQDITERKNAELKLEEQNKELVKTNSELDHFVYSTSHDLRAPLTSIMGLIGLLETETLNDNATDLIRLMKSCLTKSDDTIKEIIDYSRNSRFEIRKEKIDTEKLIEEIFENIALFDLSKQINKKLTVSTSADFCSDKLRLKIILSNIMFNAVKYSKPETKFAEIEVDVDITQERALIIIQDRGIGIEPELISRVFEMFYRATELSTGSGLGLYITKECVEKLGGTIDLQSEFGVSTTITLNIPNRLIT